MSDALNRGMEPDDVQALHRMEDDGGKSVLSQDKNALSERQQRALSVERSWFLKLAEVINAPLPEIDAQQAAKNLAPKMHKKWVRDRQSEGRSMWLRKHGFGSKEELQEWIDRGGFVKHWSMRPDVTEAIRARTDILPEDQWKWFDLLAFQEMPDKGPGDFQNLPPLWQEKSAQAARENVNIVNGELQHGKLSAESFDRMSEKVHENWVLSNFANRAGEWLTPYTDAAKYAQAVQALEKWNALAYGALPADPTELTVSRQQALSKIDEFARSAKIPQETSDLQTKVLEFRDQFSSWEHLSFAERLKDYAVINETMAEIGYRSIFVQHSDKE